MKNLKSWNAKLEFVGQFGSEAALGPLFEGAGKNL